MLTSSSLRNCSCHFKLTSCGLILTSCSLLPHFMLSSTHTQTKSNNIDHNNQQPWPPPPPPATAAIPYAARGPSHRATALKLHPQTAIHPYYHWCRTAFSSTAGSLSVLLLRCWLICVKMLTRLLPACHEHPRLSNLIRPPTSSYNPHHQYLKIR